MTTCNFHKDKDRVRATSLYPYTGAPGFALTLTVGKDEAVFHSLSLKDLGDLIADLSKLLMDTDKTIEPVTF